MLSQWELWACANELIKQHEEDAAVIAAMRADELMDQGDLEGARALQAIVRRINDLLEPPQGAPN